MSILVEIYHRLLGLGPDTLREAAHILREQEGRSSRPDSKLREVSWALEDMAGLLEKGERP